MINRLLLRNKVIQTLYAHYTSGENSDLRVAESELLHSIDKSNDLYHALLNLIVETTCFMAQRIDAAKNKMLPTKEESNPNVRFVDNRFAHQLEQNLNLGEYLSFSPFSWRDHAELMKELVQTIESAQFYQDYMSSEESSYELDKEVWVKIFKKVLPKLRELPIVVEDSSIYWIDDLDVEVSFVIKTIKLFQEENAENQPLPLNAKTLASNEKELAYIEEKTEAQAEDIRYATKLLGSVIASDAKFTKMISDVTPNWDHSRMVLMDTIIIKTALAELLDFPTIPVNVTLNEYIELTKFYSTKKSSLFVNGVLDKLLSDLKENNKLQKPGMY